MPRLPIVCKRMRWKNHAYEMKKGVTLICIDEAETVKEIFNEYLSGKALNDIADALKQKGSEYLPGVSDWNKSCVKRIIDDARYCGNEKYPQIISNELYNTAKLLKQERNTVKTYTVRNEDKPVIKITICPDCGGKLRHITDNTGEKSERFVCENCRLTVYKTVAELKKNTTEILNRLIADPSLIVIEEVGSYCESPDIRCKTGKIERMTAALDVETETVQRN